MTERKLLMTTRSPFARKAAIALLEKGLAYEAIPVDLAKKPLVLLQSGPLQKIPVLLEHGLTIGDSTVICEYLEERYLAHPLLPPGYLLRMKARTWEDLADHASECAITIFMDLKKPASLRNLAEVMKAEGNLARILAQAEAHMVRSAFMVGEQFTVADAAFLSALGYVEFRLGNKWRVDHPALVRYLSAHENRPSMLATVPRD